MNQKWKNLFKVNRGLVPIKLAYFIFAFGTSMVYPFQALQMFTIGLTYNEIAIIMGGVQAISFVAAPITGFIGDKIGYKIVILVVLAACAISGTCLDYTPRVVEKIRTPTVQLAQSVNRTSKYDYVIVEISWPPTCNESNDTLSLCQESVPVVDESFWQNITEYLDCSEYGPQEPNWTLDTSFDVNAVSTFEMERNGTFCSANSTLDLMSLNQTKLSCFVNYHPDIPACKKVEGSQTKTFWIYFAIRTIFQICVNSGYALYDGTAIKLVKQHNADYSFVLLWQLVAATIGPYVAGTLIEESDDPNIETDFSIAYYMMDGAIAAVFVVTFFLDVAMEKSEEKISSSVKKLFVNPATITFLFINLIMGIGWGAADAYLSIYLTEELNASYALIGIGSSIALGSGIPMLPLAKYIVKFIGELNLLTLACLVTGVRLVLYAYITWSPPYHYLILCSFEFLLLTLQWIACVQYISITCPDTLVGTMVATVGAAQNVLGRAVGSVLAGQIVTNMGLEIPEMFNAVGISICVGGIVCYIFYRLVCQKYEMRLVDAKQSQGKSVISDLDLKKGRWMNRTNSELEFEKVLRNAAGITRL